MKSLVLLPSCLLIVQLLTSPILANKKSPNRDEYLVEDQRTRLRKNYFLQRALNDEMIKNQIDLTSSKDPLKSNANSEELPARIVDYANLIRNDIILLDNSIETRTRKRGNIEEEPEFDPLEEVPCRCEADSKDPMFLDADHFPTTLETRRCDTSLCPAPYLCHPRLHNITVLKRNRRVRLTDEISEEELPEDIPNHWVAIKKPVVVGCFCLRNYDGSNLI